ncbi:MAG: metallophosphoesterase family protein [Gemmatimonadaceae bacterium]|nr:metallophosphoesterase family protein [Gemmatimonadaceae bacterium]
MPPAADQPLVIGLISDTHGQVRADVHRALAGVDCILHAGDVCGDDVLMELALIAPVRAVYGNCDAYDDPQLVREIERSERGVRIHVSHGHELGVPTVQRLLAAYDADVIVYGHTHRQLIARAGGRLVINPGAAGPRRFDLTPSVARLTIAPDGAFDVELVDLAY